MRSRLRVGTTSRMPWSATTFLGIISHSALARSNENSVSRLEEAHGCDQHTPCSTLVKKILQIW